MPFFLLIIQNTTIFVLFLNTLWSFSLLEIAFLNIFACAQKMLLMSSYYRIKNSMYFIYNNHANLKVVKVLKRRVSGVETLSFRL